MANKKNNTKSFHLARRWIYLFSLLAILIVIFIVYISVSVAQSGVKDDVYTAFDIDDETEIKPSIISNEKFTDLNVELYAKSYVEAGVTTDSDGEESIDNGSIQLNIEVTGVKDGQSCTGVTVEACLSAKWINWASSSSSSYSITSLTSASAKTPTLTLDTTFPQKALLNMITIKNPNVYLYIQYTKNGTDYAYIVEYEYEDWFLTGTTTHEKL